MSVDISVLVPVYNVEQSLERCVQSIQRQTFQNIEVILIDDGSVDKSGMLSDELLLSNPNYIIVHKKNEGLGPTRNKGILLANGEYVYHCDSDDWLKEDLLEKTHAALTSAGAEVCIFGYDIFQEKDGSIVPYNSITLPAGTYTTSADVKKLFVDQYFNAFAVMSACNRLYQRDFLIRNNLFFPALRRAQDMAYSLLLFDKTQRLVTLHESYYCYIIEPGVFKGRSFDEMINIYLHMYDLTSGTFREWDLLDKDEEMRLRNRTCVNIANYSSFALVKKYPEQKREILKKLIRNRNIGLLFAGYSNQKKSRFMSLFCLGIKYRSRLILELAARLHEFAAGR